MPQTSTPAISTGSTNLNRLTTSFHLTPVCVPRPSTRRPQTRIAGGLIAAIKSNRARTPQKKIARKQIGWECRDRIGYNNEVCACLYVDDCRFAQESRHSDGRSFPLLFFTGGSARNISRREECAGWGFTAKSSNQNRDGVPMVEACG